MKHMKSLIVAISLFVLPLSAFGHGGIDHPLKQSKKVEHSSHDQKGKTKELQGHLVELSCYLKHDGIGEKHRDCAKECAEKGLPLGVLTKDGTLYQIMGEGHEDLREVNKKLLDYVEQDVQVVGKVFEKNHTFVVVIQKIKKL